MMQTDTTAKTFRGFSQEALEELIRRKGEPEWAAALRTDAWQAYLATPMPSRKDEEWRRTDLSMLDLDGVAPFAEGSGPADPTEDIPTELRSVLKGSAAPGGLLVHRNSRAVHRRLAGDLSARGVILADLDDAVRQHPELVRRHLMACVGPAEGKLVALHSAFWSGGTFVYVPRTVEVEVPIHAITWSDALGVSVMPHTLVVLEEGAGLVFVEESASPAGQSPALANGVVELVLGAGSRLSYISLQRWGPSVFAFGTQRAVVGRDAELATLSVCLGGRMSKSWVQTHLRERGASTRMLGIGFGSGVQRFHHHTLQDHQAPNTASDLLFKTALDGEARSEYSGLIRVHPDSQKTDAYQADRNLLLSRHARADSMPRLEIQANDVRCTHGATVGPIDEEQLFYLMARGLPRLEAERMIVQGFFEPVMERIPVESIRERIRRAVDAKISAGGR